MTIHTYTRSDLEALRERCAKVAEENSGSDCTCHQCNTIRAIVANIRALPITQKTEEEKKP